MFTWNGSGAERTWEDQEESEVEQMQKLDQVETVQTDSGSEIFESAIHEYLQEYIDTHEIEDMHREPQSRWNAALLYINKNYFKLHPDMLKAGNYCDGNLKHGNSSNNNAYDLDIINYICDIYIDLCYEYDKEISCMGFGKLTGISQDTLYQWGAETSRPSSSGSEIFKKLTTEREESLSNMLISGKRNPVGLLGALNRHYGWNMGQPRGVTGEQKQSIEQIQERYKVEQAPDKPLLEPPKADF